MNPAIHIDKYETSSFVLHAFLDRRKDRRCLHISIMPMIHPVPLVPMALLTVRASAV
jgi:hypothetical protein